MDRSPSPKHETRQASASASSSRMVDAPEEVVVVYDDIERLLFHEDMPQLLVLATNVKSLYQALKLVPAPTPINASRMDPREVLAVVDRMQQQLSSEKKPMVYRGTFPLTDSILEESLLILQTEVERCEQYLLQRQEQEAAFHQLVMPSLSEGQSDANPISASSSSPDATAPTRRCRKPKRDDAATSTSNGIAPKYAKWQTDILMEWMMDNKAHPFPISTEIEKLSQRTCLSHSQVVNWTTNVRKRNLKATVEQGKKPHHFLDFLFLAQDRDQQNELEAANEEPQHVVDTPVRRSRTKKTRAAKSAQHKRVVDSSKTETRRNEAPASDAYSPCRTPRKSAAVSPTASTIKSPDVRDGNSDSPKPRNVQDNHHQQAGQDARETAKSFGSAGHATQAKGSFVSPCMSPTPRYDHRSSQPHHSHAGAFEQIHRPQPPPSPYRVTHYHAYYSHQRQSHIPPATPFLPRACATSSDYYFYNPSESGVSPATSSPAASHYHEETYSRHIHAHHYHPHDTQLHSVSESFDNNSNESVMVGPTDLLDPWGDEENECAHAGNGSSGAHDPSSLMDAFARYWFEKCQDQDDREEDDDDDKTSPSSKTAGTIPTSPRRFGSSLGSSPPDNPRAAHIQQQKKYHNVPWQDHRIKTATKSAVKRTELPEKLDMGCPRSPTRRAVTNQELKDDHVKDEKKTDDQKKATKQRVVPVKRSERTKVNTSKNARFVKRQRSASFDDDTEDEEEEEEWTARTTTHDEGDVADFIRELGLDEVHDV